MRIYSHSPAMRSSMARYEPNHFTMDITHRNRYGALLPGRVTPRSIYMPSKRDEPMLHVVDHDHMCLRSMPFSSIESMRFTNRLSL